MRRRPGPAARAVGVLVALAAAAGSAASDATGFLPPAYSPADVGVAVLAKGVVWVEQNRVLYQGFSSPAKVLGGLQEPSPALSASPTAVVVAGRGGREAFSAAVPPGRLAPVGQIWAPLKAGGCEWLPAETGGLGEFVVVGEQIVDAATCPEELLEAQAAKQPLFVRNAALAHQLQEFVDRGWRGHRTTLAPLTRPRVVLEASLYHSNYRPGAEGSA